MRRIAIIVILVISLAFVGCSYTPDTSDSYVNVDGSETTPYDIDTSEAQSIDVSESSETVEINNGGTYDKISLSMYYCHRFSDPLHSHSDRRMDHR